MLERQAQSEDKKDRGEAKLEVHTKAEAKTSTYKLCTHMAGLRQLWQEAGTVRSETHCDPVFPVPFLLHSGARCQMALGAASPTLANLHRGRTASKEGMALPWDDTTTGKGM